MTQLDLVTTAIGHGRRAAEAIDRKFLGTGRRGRRAEGHPHRPHAAGPLREERSQRAFRASTSNSAWQAVDVEVNLGFTPDQVIEESRRCMSCGYCFDCEKCWLFCQDQAVVKPMQKGVLYTFKMENCTGCKKCAEECPCGFIDML